MLHRIAATNRHTFTHLIVSQHSAQLGTPVDHGIAQIGDAVVHQHIILLCLSHRVPLLGSECVGAIGVGITTLGAMVIEVGNQVLNGTCLVKSSIIVTLEHLQECPLGPLVVSGVTGFHFTVPIIAKSYLVQLLAVARDVLVGGDFRMLSRLDSILLGWQTIGIITHGMQHVKSL